MYNVRHASAMRFDVLFVSEPICCNYFPEMLGFHEICNRNNINIISQLMLKTCVTCVGHKPYYFLSRLPHSNQFRRGCRKTIL